MAGSQPRRRPPPGQEDAGQILGLGDRAFNLRVADPYLPYQMQGVGFTWSFFTHKDPQDCHVHGAPVVELYGILEGSLEIWWKPYYERGRRPGATASCTRATGLRSIRFTATSCTG